MGKYFPIANQTARIAIRLTGHGFAWNITASRCGITIASMEKL